MPSTQQTTKEYSKFVMNSINRAVMADDGYKPRADLVTSMKAIGYSPVCPIICRQAGDKLEIIDGHNRFAAAQFLGLEVHYIVYTDKEIGQMDPLMFSRSQKTWTMKDVVSGFAHNGDDDYAELIDYCKRTGITLGIAASVHFGDSGGSNNAQKKIREGTFQIKDRIAPAIVADLVHHVGLFVPWNTTVNLVIALSKCIHARGFDPKVLKEKISKHPEMLAKRRTLDEYLDLLEEIYNRFSKSPRYRLRQEVEDAMYRRGKKHLRAR